MDLGLGVRRDFDKGTPHRESCDSSSSSSPSNLLNEGVVTSIGLSSDEVGASSGSRLTGLSGSLSSLSSVLFQARA